MEKKPGGIFAVAKHGGIVRVLGSDLSGWGQGAHAETGGVIDFDNCRVETPRLAELRILLEDAPLSLDEKLALLQALRTLDGPDSPEASRQAKGIIDGIRLKHGLAVAGLLERIKALFESG